MQIKIFENTIGNKEFYAYMGKFFAESNYKKEMPYLSNSESNVWILAMEDDCVIGFVSFKETTKEILLQHDFVEQNHRNKGIWKSLNKERLKMVPKNKPLQTTTNNQYLIKYWNEHSFKCYRTNGSYSYLRKDVTK